VNALGWLVALWLLLKQKKTGPAVAPWFPTGTPGVHPSHTTHAAPHGNVMPATHPAAFPAVPPTPAQLIPASVPSGPTFSKKWVPYHPLTQPVIARAEQLLHDPHAKDETIEQNPSGAGVVRYLKLHAPKGRLSVTAWKPTLDHETPSHVVPS
jgi:hypothetical protein